METSSPHDRVVFSLSLAQLGVIAAAVILGIFVTVGAPVLAVQQQYRDLNSRFEAYRAQQDSRTNEILSGVADIRENVAAAASEIRGVHDWIRGNTTVGTGR